MYFDFEDYENLGFGGWYKKLHYEMEINKLFNF